MKDAYIAGGSNLGDRAGYLERACRQLRKTPGIQLIRVSPVYETEAHTSEQARSSEEARASQKSHILTPQDGPTAQKAGTSHTVDEMPPFLNVVFAVRTSLTAENLLVRCQEIEQIYGRSRSSGGHAGGEGGEGRGRTRTWQTRTLDLDLLLYGDDTISRAALQVPHPRMGRRRFVLQPLADLAPDRSVPAPFDMTVADMLTSCSDDAAVRRTNISLCEASRESTEHEPGEEATEP